MAAPGLSVGRSDGPCEPPQLVEAVAPVVRPLRVPVAFGPHPLGKVHGWLQFRLRETAGAEQPSAHAVSPGGLGFSRLSVGLGAQPQPVADGVLDHLATVLHVVPLLEVDLVLHVPDPGCAGELAAVQLEDPLDGAVLPCQSLDGVELPHHVVGPVCAHPRCWLQAIPRKGWPEAVPRQALRRGPKRHPAARGEVRREGRRAGEARRRSRAGQLA
mmetsp:Transcript_113876/g.323004  ORF Transcript_113876/g.323004 Transcript_113876/m.323004 type:complete len:215 (-) Transcript_113876:8-652(-)